MYVYKVQYTYMQSQVQHKATCVLAVGGANCRMNICLCIYDTCLAGWVQPSAKSRVSPTLYVFTTSVVYSILYIYIYRENTWQANDCQELPLNGMRFVSRPIHASAQIRANTLLEELCMPTQHLLQFIISYSKSTEQPPLQLLKLCSVPLTYVLV